MMRLFLAYWSVVLLWATTPLAIKWSAESAGFVFGAAARMSLGLLCLLPFLLFRRGALHWHGRAIQTYIAVALQIYGAMLCVYWGAQFIPSGWVSVIFGLTPLITALLAAAFLKESSLSFGKVLAYASGIGGLTMMFVNAQKLGSDAAWGIAGVLLASFWQALSAVWVKRIDAKLPALTQVGGGLLFAVPVYLVTWYWLDGQWPESFSPAGLYSILYLGMIATTFGFILYYYVLTHLSATKVALITLVSPALALYLGHAVNQEPLNAKVIGGSLLIFLALFLYSLSERSLRQRQLAKA